MAEVDTATLVAAIHEAPVRLVLAITGGGSRAIAELLEVPGGSRTLLEAVVPYSSTALEDWLGAAPEQFCSARTSRAMAMAAFLKGRALIDVSSGSHGVEIESTVAPPHPSPLPEREGTDVVLGIGCTASLVSDRPKHGPHRVHVAWQTVSAAASNSVELVKQRRNRVEEERIAARLILNAIADAAGVTDRLVLETQGDEPLTHERIDAPAAWQDLLWGTAEAVQHPNGALEPTPFSRDNRAAGPRALFPGAFNPLHDGHRRMIELAATILGMPVEVEMSIENVDKPPLDFIEMDQRLRQFDRQTLWFTRASTFVRKAELFPGATFVVGADTIRRIADPRYYGDKPELAAAAIDRIRKQGASFLVFGRDCDGRLETLRELDLPDRLREICIEVPLEQFRLDISSTAMRAGIERTS
jgi:nicotinic acid mononucleotide adenylyltransferase